VQTVPRLWEFYPGICLKNEEKARKNLSQCKENLSQVTKTLSQVKKNLSQSTVYILPKQPHKHAHYAYYTHILKDFAPQGYLFYSFCIMSFNLKKF
jgi:hypothetical protein